MKLFIFSDLKENFDGSKWGYNGPELITRVFRKLCNFTEKIEPQTCKKFTILPPEDCYSIGYNDWKMLFNASAAVEVKRKTKNSHFIHLWNKFSRNYLIQTNSKAAFITFANKFCPKVFQSRDKYF